MVQITKWQPIIDAYKDKFGNIIEMPVAIVVNPKRTSKKVIVKKYEKEIKKWIGIPEDQEFDVAKFYQ